MHGGLSSLLSHPPRNLPVVRPCSSVLGPACEEKSADLSSWLGPREILPSLSHRTAGAPHECWATKDHCACFLDALRQIPKSPVMMSWDEIWMQKLPRFSPGLNRVIP